MADIPGCNGIADSLIFDALVHGWCHGTERVGRGPFGRGPLGVWVLAGLCGSNLYGAILAFSIRCPLTAYVNLSLLLLPK
jgi:hypothetical protein